MTSLEVVYNYVISTYYKKLRGGGGRECSVPPSPNANTEYTTLVHSLFCLLQVSLSIMKVSHILRRRKKYFLQDNHTNNLLLKPRRLNWSMSCKLRENVDFQTVPI